MLFRYHRGTLLDSLRTLTELPATMEALSQHLGISQDRITCQRVEDSADERINWAQTVAICVDGNQIGQASEVPTQEWTLVNLPFGHTSIPTTFAGQRLARPGVLMRISPDAEGGPDREVLIGHVNVQLGTCDDCRNVMEEDTIVKAYKVVWEESCK